jgi:penicillin-binding protein 2
LFEDIKEGLRQFLKSRLTVSAFVMLLLFSVLLWRVFYLQVVTGETYQDNYTLKILKERTLNSTRGNIYDRNGKLLAYNELAYSITIEDNGSYSSTKEKNKLLNAELAQIITAIEKCGDSVYNDFKIDYTDDGMYDFNVSGTSLKRFLADVFGESSYTDLQDNTALATKLGYDPSVATADQVMSYLFDTYGVEDSYDGELGYEIVVIRFAISQNAYQKYISTTIAANVSDESVAYISEHESELQGVEISDDTIRKYNNSEYFASILGYTGKISSEEYETLSADDDSYTLNDVIGKAGIEQYMDSYLKGQKGYEKLYVDYLGKTVQIIEREDPVSGNDVYLSIDSDLQIAVYHLLEQEIAGIVYSNIENATSDINIPITDVYFALINNNVIDTSHFEESDASQTEKDVLEIFEARKSVVKSQLMAQLGGEDDTLFKNLNSEFQDYITLIINSLKGSNILISSNIDSSDDVYQKWQQGEVSTEDYLNHAIAKGWIDITGFSVEEKYSDSTEIYDALCNYILDNILSETDFSKIIYEYLIESGAVSGKQLCLILYDQGILAFDEEEVASLTGGSVSALSFIKDKIKSLEITPAQLALDPCSGSCVITNTKTGELLALVSYPGYDNNMLANTVDQKYYSSLQNDLSLPLYNYATQQGTAPGSTFKMVISTAGLAEKYISTTETITDRGIYENISNHPKCWSYSHGYTHGAINVSEALRDSCNYFFYEVGYRLSTSNYSSSYSDEAGIEKIQEYASMFGLDETSGIEIVENDPKIADQFPVMAAIGQSNNRYTTVQLARYVTAIANGGTVYNYTLLDRVEDSEGNVIAEYSPEVRNTIDVLTDDQWRAIKYGMRLVVENTSDFSGFSIPTAGKTGTAQQVSNRPNHALFVGYAPYDDPEISIATRIAYGYTSHNAAAVSKDILAYYFGVEDEDDLLSGEASDTNSTSNEFTD